MHKILASSNPTIRAWAVRATGNEGRMFPEDIAKVVALANDESPDVKLQVAIAARKIEGIDALPLLVQIAANCGDDPLIPHIVWQNLHPLLEKQGTQFLAEVKKYDLKKSPALAKILPRATERMLAKQK